MRTEETKDVFTTKVKVGQFEIKITPTQIIRIPNHFKVINCFVVGKKVVLCIRYLEHYDETKEEFDALHTDIPVFIIKRGNEIPIEARGKNTELSFYYMKNAYIVTF